MTPARQAQVFRWINGKDPRQYGLDFGLWTRQIAAALIEQKFGVSLGVTAVGRVLARLGLTPQKPLQRAYQRDPQAIERWQSETYPGIAAAAKQSGADIYFWDESGFRADTVHGKTWAPKGKTPVVERPGQRQSISAASAVNAKGGFWFATYQGALNAELFIELPGHRQSLQVRHTESLPQGLPAFSRLPRDVELPRYSCSGAFPPQARLLAAQEVTANPSLEPTRSGKSPWPPSAEYHVAPVGQGALPPRSAQLKR